MVNTDSLNARIFAFHLTFHLTSPPHLLATRAVTKPSGSNFSVLYCIAFPGISNLRFDFLHLFFNHYFFSPITRMAGMGYSTFNSFSLLLTSGL